jgi:hypothetical protein
MFLGGFLARVGFRAPAVAAIELCLIGEAAASHRRGSGGLEALRLNRN